MHTHTNVTNTSFPAPNCTLITSNLDLVAGEKLNLKQDRKFTKPIKALLPPWFDSLYHCNYN